jgi:hypothetical protein
MMGTRALLVAGACFALTACGSVLPDQPNFSSNLVLPRTGDPTNLPAYTHTQYNSQVLQGEPQSCIDFDTAGSKTVDLRNACIVDLKTDIDDAYDHYEVVVNDTIGATNSTLDITTQIGSTASAATSGSAAKILSAISAVASNGKTVFNQDVLYKDTIQILISTMRADRSKDAAAMKLAMQGTITAYPMYQAKNDLLQYLYDGTITHALAEANQDASATAQKCQAVNNAVSTAVAAGANANVSQPASAASSNSNTTTSDQCNQIANAITFKFDTSATTKEMLSLLAPGGNYSQTADAAAEACVKSVTPPSGLDLTKYSRPDGGTDLLQLFGDSTVDATYKTQVYQCTKAGISKTTVASNSSKKATKKK